MKSVTGILITAEPISVSKAASILSKFSSSANGSTHAVSAYLRRASAAFNDLKGLHRDVKTSISKDKKPKSYVALERHTTLGSEEPGQPDDVSVGTYDGILKKEKESGGDGDLSENGGEIGTRKGNSVRKELNRERVEVSQGLSQDGESERKEGKKKKKKQNREDDENVDDGEVTTEFEAEDEHRKIDGEMGSEGKKLDS